MTDFATRRVMWLLNHTAARKFEIAMLKRIGFREFFLPKIFPSRVSFRSANADFSEDSGLTIPSDVLERFNAINWYSPQSRETWEMASQYFDIAFFINEDSRASTSLLRNFRGAAIWRAYGLPDGVTYASLAEDDPSMEPAIVSARSRVWFGQAYANLAEVEPSYLQRRSLDLPLGMPDVSVRSDWHGNDPRLLFVCPDIGFSGYYQKTYESFKRWAGKLPYVVAGAQPIAVNDPHILGFLPEEEHTRNMRELRVMYYHSQERRHVHYHPFEAVRAGMPLIFMAGGMLDGLGGVSLPGRCGTVAAARRKIERILNGDKKFTEQVRQSQSRLLRSMDFEGLVGKWQNAMNKVVEELADAQRFAAPSRTRKKRIAVIVPVGYRGGSLRGAKVLAQALRAGSVQAGSDADIVLGHLDEPDLYSGADFADLGEGIKVRPFRWRELDAAAASRAMEYAGKGQQLDRARYGVPDDGIQQFGDCDLWIVVSDRLERPLLPIRPVVLMVYDYLQRHLPTVPHHQNQDFLAAGRTADKILVTTEFTRVDAIGYAGVPSERVTKVPMLAPEIKPRFEAVSPISSAYFVWSTNAGRHKNHVAAMQALRIYYEELGGQLDCVVTGVNSGGLRDDSQENLRDAAKALTASRTMHQRVNVLGEMDDERYVAVLEGARFCWHPAIIDNGTFSVVEAARVGVPSLSSDYPAMREIDAQFGLNLTFSPSDDPVAMAERLRWMEDNAEARRNLVPRAAELENNSVERLAGAYWEAIRELL